MVVEIDSQGKAYTKEDAIKQEKEAHENRVKLAESYGWQDNDAIKNYIESAQVLGFHRTSQSRQSKIKNDFADFYRPTDDIYSSATGEDSGGRIALADLEKIGNQRVGVGYAINRRIADDMFRNWISWKEIDSAKDEKNKTTKEILKWQLDIDFYSQWSTGAWIDRWSGIAFMMDYFPRSKDPAFKHGKQKKGNITPDYTQPPPKGVLPNKVVAFDPMRMVPTNLTQTQLLTYDEEVWEFTGGNFGSAYGIHKDRIHVIRSRPLGWDWRGLAIPEPIWFSLMCYFNTMAYILKGLAKYGHVLAKYRSHKEVITAAEATAILALVEEYRANYTWICGLNEEVEFQETKVAAGINDYLEFLKEDISSMVEIPIPYLFGRAVSAGISGMGIVVSERYYMNTVGKNQHLYDYDMIKYHEKYFDIEYLRPNWNLSIQKTKEQELIEEGMEIQNKIMDEKLKQERQMTKNMKLQFEIMETLGLNETQDEPSELPTSGKEGTSSKEPKKQGTKSDFVEPRIINLYFNNNKVDYDLPFKIRKIGEELNND